MKYLGKINTLCVASILGLTIDPSSTMTATDQVVEVVSNTQNGQNTLEMVQCVYSNNIDYQLSKKNVSSTDFGPFVG